MAFTLYRIPLNHLHKKTGLTLLLGLLLIVLACDKDNDAPTPGPGPGPTPVVTTNDTLGVGWSQQKIGDSALVDVFFQDSLVGYVGGVSVYKTNNGGVTWIRVPNTEGATNLFITPDQALHAVSFNATVYRKFTNWAQNSIATVLEGNGRGYDVYFTNSNSGFLTTDRGLLKTANGGNKWELVTNATGLQVRDNSGLSFLDSATGWIFTGSKAYRTNGTMTNWSASNMPADPIGNITAIHVLSANSIYLASMYGNILKSTDGGANFKEVGKLSTTPIYAYTDIHFLDDLLGYACNNNRIYQTNDGGRTWAKVLALATSQIIELHFVDADRGWACTLDGRVLKYKR